MRQELLEIEQIENYLLGKLKEEEVSKFEERMALDNELKEKVDQQDELVGGLDRIALLASINRAKRKSGGSGNNGWKWGAGIVVLLILSIASVFFLYRNIEHIEGVQNKFQSLQQPESGSVKQTKSMEEVASTSEGDQNIVNESTSLDIANEAEVMMIEEVESGISELFSRYVQRSQIFKIDPSKSQTIVGSYGTQVTFPAKSLHYKGKYPKKSIQIIMREIYNYSDMVKANLTTSTTNGELLETGGMIHLEAFYKGKKLELNTKKPITIKFPSRKGKKGMQTFSGVKNTREEIEWHLEPQTKMYAKEKAKVGVDPSFMAGLPTEVKSSDEPETQPEPVKGLDFLTKTIQETLNAYKISGYERTTANVKFQVQPDGELTDIEIMSGTGAKKHQNLNRIILYLVQQSSPWKPATISGKNIKQYFLLPIKIKVEGLNTTKEIDEYNAKNWPWNDIDLTQPLNPAVSTAKLDRAINNVGANNIAISQFEGYVLHSTKLDWINCDRFYRSKSKKTNIVVDVGEIDKYQCSVKLIFHTIKSVMAGYPNKSGVLFQNIPINKKVTIVAFKYENGEVLMATKECTTALNQKIDLDFKPVTIQELEMGLKKMDKLN